MARKNFNVVIFLCCLLEVSSLVRQQSFNTDCGDPHHKVGYFRLSVKNESEMLKLKHPLIHICLFIDL